MNRTAWHLTVIASRRGAFQALLLVAHRLFPVDDDYPARLELLHNDMCKYGVNLLWDLEDEAGHFESVEARRIADSLGRVTPSCEKRGWVDRD